jgi:hypothetical protein
LKFWVGIQIFRRLGGNNKIDPFRRARQHIAYTPKPSVTCLLVGGECLLQRLVPEIGVGDDTGDNRTAIELAFPGDPCDKSGFTYASQMVCAVLVILSVALYEYSFADVVSGARVQPELFQNIGVHARMQPQVMMRIDYLSIRIDNFFTVQCQPLIVFRQGFHEMSSPCER